MNFFYFTYSQLFFVRSRKKMHTSSSLVQSSGCSWLRLGAGLLAAIIFLISRRLVQDYQHEKRYRFPPIVPGLPIVGNSMQLPTRVGLQGPYLAKLAEKHGEM